MIASALLFLPSSLLDTTHLKSHLERLDERLCCSTLASENCLVIWTRMPMGLTCPFPDAPWEQKPGGDLTKLPNLALSSQYTLLSPQPDVCWPEEAPLCSLFHNIWMKCGSKGHQLRVTQHPTSPAPDSFRIKKGKHLLAPLQSSWGIPSTTQPLGIPSGKF